MKAAERSEEKLKKEKEKELQNYSRMHDRQNRLDRETTTFAINSESVDISITCKKCRNLNASNSNFCV